MYSQNLLCCTSLSLSHSNLKQLDLCVEAAHNSAFNRISFNKLLCDKDKTHQILLSLSDNAEYWYVKLLGSNIDNQLDR